MPFLPKFLRFRSRARARSIETEIEKAIQAQEAENERREGHQRNCYTKEVCEASFTFRMKPWGAMREIPSTFDQQPGTRKQWEFPGPKTPHLPRERLLEQCEVAPDEQRPKTPEWLNALGRTAAPKYYMASQVSAAVITFPPDDNHVNTNSAPNHNVQRREIEVSACKRRNVQPNSLDEEDAELLHGASIEGNSLPKISQSAVRAAVLLTSPSSTPISKIKCMRDGWTEEEKTARDQEYAQTLKEGDMMPWVRLLDGQDIDEVSQRKNHDSGYRSGHYS